MHAAITDTRAPVVWPGLRVLLAYGVALAVCTALAMSVLGNPVPVLDVRAQGIAASVHVLDAGGPPLAGRRADGSYYAVGTTDDQGLYLYGGLAGHIFGATDPYLIVKWIWIGAYGLTILIAPLVYTRLFGRAAGILAPLALALLVISFGASDVYWAGPWAVLTLLPLVFLLAQRWSRAAIPLLLAIGLGASLATSVRSGSGLGVVIAAALVILRAPTSWPKRAGCLALLAAAYLAITPLGLAAVRSYRNHDLHTQLGKNQPTSHSLWHNTYIGLGYMPNRWRLQYRDQLAIETVQKARPGTKFLGPGYDSELRKLWSRAVSEDPSYFVRESLEKVVAAIGHSARFLVVMVLALTAIALVGLLGRVRYMALLSLPALALAVVPVVLVMPIHVYELPLYGVIGLIAVLAIALAAEPALAAVRARRLPVLGQVRRPAVAAGLALLLIGATWAGTHALDTRSNDWQARHLGPPLIP